MKPFVKWAGGKEKELPIIEKNMPSTIKRYIEPFVGGGAVYFNIFAEKSIINDKSDELISLYKYIKDGNKTFFEKIEDINHNWIVLEKFVDNNSSDLVEIYKNYSNDMLKSELSKIEIKQKYCDVIIEFVVVKHGVELNGLLQNYFNIDIEHFIKEIQRNLISKIVRMFNIECKNQKMSEKDILDNIECAFKASYYTHFRYLYNEKDHFQIKKDFASAIFYFIRENCYASMFRYNSHGKFNVPYGGISYNRKDFSKKISYLKSIDLKNHMTNTELYNLDFEQFCEEIELKEDDFIFLDPPYDTEFSTYAGNSFGKEDQERLAKFLKKTKAKFMLVIKNTDFIYNLYNVKEFKIEKFEKKYLVSFQNRNDKDVEHLIITNY